MLIYDRNIVTEGGTGLEEELISKKELLEQYQISYGALYRWKRMGLIPEGWFLRRLAAELQGQKQAAAAERMLILETKYGLKTYPLDALIHLYLAEGEHKTDILEHLKEETL